MKLGILIAGRRPEDIGQRLAQAREAGFSLCQLNLHQTGYTRADMIAIMDLLEDYGVRASAVGCYVNPLKPDDARLNGTCRADLNLVLSSLDLLGARRIVIWSGTHAEAQFAPDERNQTEESEHVLREFVTDVVNSTRCRHYWLVIEPWRTHVLSDEEKVVRFHNSLAPHVQEHVRFVLDAPNLITADRYPACMDYAMNICRRIGPLAGVVHLKDCIMPPDADEALVGPGRGKLNYADYLEALMGHADEDVPAIIKNVPITDFAVIRDDVLRLSDQFELV
jgi:sugar phosphate isomerase/epimerase